MCEQITGLRALLSASAQDPPRDPDPFSHVGSGERETGCERAKHELQELKRDIHSDMGEAIRGKGESEIVIARLKAYEDVMGLIDVRLDELSNLTEQGWCGHCDQPREIFYTTDDDVDLCEGCYQSLREEMTVRDLKPVPTFPAPPEAP